jgi:branched-subunit amino acid aminotransferase/4-amino-4-deoxychorismate lyase
MSYGWREAALRVLLLNGRDITTQDCLGFLDGNFFQGTRVMTTMLAQGHAVVDFNRHLDRLLSHATELLSCQLPSAELLEFEVQSTLERLAERGGSRVRLMLFQDASGLINRLIDVMSVEADTLMAKHPDGGVRLLSHTDRSWIRGSHVKTGLLGAHREKEIIRARTMGFEDVLWVNSEGEIAEATWANIFLIGRTGDLVEIATPPAASGLLLGLVRRRICELLYTAKIPVTERVVTIDELPRFDEAFVTSSIRGLIPVSQIDKHRLQTTRPNSVFHHILRLYQTWLSTEKVNNISELNKVRPKTDA